MVQGDAGLISELHFKSQTEHKPKLRIFLLTLETGCTHQLVKDWKQLGDKMLIFQGKKWLLLFKFKLPAGDQLLPVRPGVLAADWPAESGRLVHVQDQKTFPV